MNSYEAFLMAGLIMIGMIVLFLCLEIFYVIMIRKD